MVGGTGNFPNDVWIEVVGNTHSALLIARRRHIERPALKTEREQTENERRFEVIRKLQNMDNGWALPLTEEQVSALGLDETDTAVLVRLVDGDPPRLVIRRAPTFSEAMEDTLATHGEALRRLAAVPDIPSGL